MIGPTTLRRVVPDSAYIVAACFFCLFSFKFKLVDFGETGVRADDFLSLGIFMLLARRGVVTGRNTPGWLKLYIGFVLFGIVSSFMAWSQGRVELVYSVIFNIRLLQYVIFFYAGIWVANRGIYVDKWFAAYFILLLIVIPLQFMRVLPVPGGFDPSRASANTNGPYELAMLASFLFFFPWRIRQRWLVQAAAYVIILATASRITTLAVSGFILFWLLKKLVSGARIYKLLSLVALASALLVSAAIDSRSQGQGGGGSSSIFDRFRAFDVSEQFDLIQRVYDVVPIYTSSAAYVDEAYNDAIEVSAQSDTDRSANIRFLRWTTLFKSSMANPMSFLFGLGPSFGTAAVDGSFVRIFVETGLVGLGIFVSFAVALLRDRRYVTPSGHRYFIVVLISGIFIDSFSSYKAMIFLWFWLGYCYRSKVLDKDRIRNER